MGSGSRASVGSRTGLAWDQDPGLAVDLDPGLAWDPDPGLAWDLDPELAWVPDPGLALFLNTDVNTGPEYWLQYEYLVGKRHEEG